MIHRRTADCGLRMLLLLVAISLTASIAQAQSVSAARYAHLTRGINMGEWFRDRYQPRYGAGDLKLLRTLGVRYVRLPVGSHLLFDETQPAILRTDGLQHLDEAVNLILGQDLAVMVCVFDEAGKVWQQADYAAKYALFWRALAAHLSATNPERVFLEVVNEPAAETAELWNAIQPKLLAAMRAGAPHHTLIAFANMRTAPDKWDNIGGLERLHTVSDPNVIYNIHFFEPMTFTHQGATWGWDKLKYLHGLPYPSSSEQVMPLLPGIDVSARQEVISYGRAAWDRRKIDALLRRVADWERSHGVRALCNEIGVYRAAAPADSRLRWLQDVRETLEKFHIGWGMWEYDGGFGLVDTSGGRRIVDESMARALGLNVEPGVDHSAASDKSRTPNATNPRKLGYTLTFDDEFDGSTLDRSKWIDSYPDDVRTHSNNEQQYYAPDGYEVSNGILRLKAERRQMGGMPYTSGIVTTYGKFAQKYGWFEMRARFPKGKGMWPAFWLLPDDKSWPPEIDILEILGHETDKVYLTNHYNRADGKHEGKGDSYTGPDFSAGYHTFAIEWKPDEIVWYVNGIARYRTREHVPAVPMYVLANLAVGGDWPGNPDATTPFPGTMDIDYVRVYSKTGSR